MSLSETSTGTIPPDTEANEVREAPPLFIFVNRRRFTADDGVKARMTGAEIAALVGVTPDQAVVRRLHGNEQQPIGIDEVVEIQRAEHFVVTRRIVEGG